MIRILYLMQGLGVGGAEKQLLYFLQRLDRARFTPILAAFAAKGTLRTAFEAVPVPVVDLDLRFPLLRARNVLPMRRFVRWMREQQFDVLHSSLYHANILAATLGRRAGIPRIILSELNTGYFQGSVHRLAGRIVYRRATYVTVNSQAVADSLLANKMVDPCRMVMIHNGVMVPAHVPTENEAAQARHRFGFVTDGPIIASVGRFAPVKGHKYFIAAAPAVLNRYPRATFVLAGTGGCQAELEQQACDLGISESVRFLGHVEEPSELLPAVDVFVLPSLSEGLSNALMEAMAAARPVVATAVGGNNHLIEHERSGLLVPPSNESALATAICALVAEPERARRLGAAARVRVEPYSVDRMSARYMQLYEQSFATA